MVEDFPISSSSRWFIHRENAPSKTIATSLCPSRIECISGVVLPEFRSNSLGSGLGYLAQIWWQILPTYMECSVTKVHQECDVVLFNSPQNFKRLSPHCQTIHEREYTVRTTSGCLFIASAGLKDILGDVGFNKLLNADFTDAAETTELMLSLRSRPGLSTGVVGSTRSS